VAVDSAEEEVSEDEELYEEDFALRDTEQVFVEEAFVDEELHEEDFALRDTEQVFVEEAFVDGDVGLEVEVEAEEEVFAEDVAEEEEELPGWCNDGPKTPTQSLLMP